VGVGAGRCDQSARLGSLGFGQFRIGRYCGNFPWGKKVADALPAVVVRSRFIKEITKIVVATHSFNSYRLTVWSRWRRFFATPCPPRPHVFQQMGFLLFCASAARVANPLTFDAAAVNDVALRDVFVWARFAREIPRKAGPSRFTAGDDFHGITDAQPA
jgi:hypothetical protein